MKAQDLANKLLENPNFNVKFYVIERLSDSEGFPLTGVMV